VRTKEPTEDASFNLGYVRGYRAAISDRGAVAEEWLQQVESEATKDLLATCKPERNRSLGEEGYRKILNELWRQDPEPRAFHNRVVAAAHADTGLADFLESPSTFVESLLRAKGVSLKGASSIAGAIRAEFSR
jgi:hypothetical protein